VRLTTEPALGHTILETSALKSVGRESIHLLQSSNRETARWESTCEVMWVLIRPERWNVLPEDQESVDTVQYRLHPKYIDIQRASCAWGWCFWLSYDMSLPSLACFTTALQLAVMGYNEAEKNISDRS
jgi:hypothetical protein